MSGCHFINMYISTLDPQLQVIRTYADMLNWRPLKKNHSNETKYELNILHSKYT